MKQAQEISTSQLITPPSLVKHGTNRPVLVIDSSDQEAENIAKFCTVSKCGYDIYFYNSTTPELEWLDTVLRIDHIVVLNQVNSLATIPSSIPFGSSTNYCTPLNYLQHNDTL